VYALYATAVKGAAADYARRGWSVIRLKGEIPDQRAERIYE
jgi:hypothetical protein